MVNRWKEEILEGEAAEKFVPGGYEDGEVSQDEYAAITSGSVSESKMAKERDSAEIYVMYAGGRRATSSLRENVTILNESAKLDTELAVVKEGSSTREQSDGQLQAQALEVRKAAFGGKVPAIAEAVQTVKYQEKVWEPSSRMGESCGSRERLNAFQHFMMQRRESKRLHTIAEKKIMDHGHVTMDEDNLGAKPRRRGRRSTDESTFERPKSTEFAAITPKNIDLIYLPRALMLDLLDDPEFKNKVIGTFVRIRVLGISESEKPYRLVLVTGTRIGEEDYKAGSTKMTNIRLEIGNLQNKEDLTIDMVSNQDFTEEEECQRLRESIKCGSIEPLTVSQVEEKAIALREDKLNHWLKSEEQRMINLRDRASENGRKKELRECVEKLQELSDQAFCAAKLQAMPEVTSDPCMDPGYESDSNDLQRKVPPNDVREKATRSGFNSSNTSLSHERGDFPHHRSRDSWEDHGRRGYYDGGRSSEKLGAGRDSALAMDRKFQSRDQDRIRDVDYNWGGNGGRIDVDTWADDYNFRGGEGKAAFGDAWANNSNFRGGEGKVAFADPWANNSNFRGGEGKAAFGDPWANNSNFRGGEGKAAFGDPWANNSNFRGGEGKAAFGDPWANNSNFRGGEGKAAFGDPWANNSNFRGGEGKAAFGDPWANNSNFRGGEGKAAFNDPWASNSNFRRGQVKAPGSTLVFGQVIRPEVGREVVSSATQASGPALRTPIGVMSETEKMWHYQDPTGMVQGPFSMEQLRNWNTVTGFFPPSRTIWKTGDDKENSEVLLTDALAGRITKETLLEGSSKRRGDHSSSIKLGADGHSTLGMDGKNQSRDQNRILGVGDKWNANGGRIVVDAWADDSNFRCGMGDGGSRKSGYGRSSSGHEYDAPVARGGSLSGSARGRFRERKACWHYAKGYCERGDDCNFRHE